jgi:ubiquinone/menaquinone biosynthesis C-methylase UbiE
MGKHTKRIFARFLDFSMSHLDGERASLVAMAKGVVVEIGFGSGRNIPFYKNIEQLYAVDPSRALYDLATERVKAAKFPVEYIEASAEDIPLTDASVDTVVSTWTQCTIPNVPKALDEAKRILKPGGKFLFIEHGRSMNRAIAGIQTFINPLWRRCAGGCNLDRDIETLVCDVGFTRVELEKAPRPGKPLAFSYKGTATK